MSLIELLAACGFIILVYMLVLWLVSLALRNSSIVDIFWGPGFILVTLVAFFLTPGGYLPRKLLVLALVSIWGLRLGLHIGRRNLGKGEDFRYRRWRETAGAAWWWRSLFTVFLLQGAVMGVVAVPLIVTAFHGQPAYLTVLDGLGVLVWAAGFIFEAVSDRQLAHFKADPANQGQVLQTGLWQYTRHPNYFGDALVWWGFFLSACSLPGGFLTIFSPLLMTFLLRRVSGVALLERSLRQTKPGYAHYAETTSAFVPRRPRR